MKRTDNELTTNLKRDETKRKAFPLALTGDDARALSVPVQRPGLTRLLGRRIFDHFLSWGPCALKPRGRAASGPKEP